MIKQSRSPIALLVAGLALSSSLASAQSSAKPPADEAELNAIRDVAHADIRAHKAALINNTMHFNEKEMQLFWPVYREYEAKLTVVNTERLMLMSSSVVAIDRAVKISADAAVMKAFDLEAKRTTLKREYYKKLKAALPLERAIQAITLEQQISLMLDLDLAGEASKAINK